MEEEKNIFVCFWTNLFCNFAQLAKSSLIKHRKAIFLAVGENQSRLMLQKHRSTETTKVCLFLLHQPLLFTCTPTASAPQKAFPRGFVQKQVYWVSQKQKSLGPLAAIAGSPLGLFTSSFAPFGRSAV